MPPRTTARRGHPMIRSAEPGEAWWWCYPDDRFYKHGPATEEDTAM